MSGARFAYLVMTKAPAVLLEALMVESARPLTPEEIAAVVDETNRGVDHEPFVAVQALSSAPIEPGGRKVASVERWKA